MDSVENRRSDLSFDASRATHVTTSFAILAASVYLLVRLTTLGWGWLLLISVPLFVAEVLAFTQLLLLAFQAWSIPNDLAMVKPGSDPSRAPSRADIIIDASRADASMLERTLVGAQSVDSRARIVVVDVDQRDDLAALCRSFDADYSIDSRLPDSNALVVFEHATSELYVWLEAGQVPMPELITGISPLFIDGRVAVCQAAVGLLNADSLVHVQRGRDEDALHRDVLAPGLARLGVAPWIGPASIVRRDAIASIGGFAGDNTTDVRRALVMLHTSGWSSTYDSHRRVREIAPDTLDQYLLQRRSHGVEALGVFRSPQNPLRVPSLTLTQRASYLATGSMFGSGIRQLVVVIVLAITLLTGRLPFDGDLSTVVVLWAASGILGIVARHELARGSMKLGDWTRHGWRTLGADLTAIAMILGLARDRRRSTHRDATGLRTLGRLRVLTLAVVLLDVALLVRAVTLFDLDLLPAFTSGGRVLVISFGLVTLVPMVDVLQLIVLRRQRRANFRLRVELAIELGGTHARTVDLATSGVGVLMAFAPIVGTSTPLRLELPTVDGDLRWIHGTAIVRAANPDESGLVRVGLEFSNLTPEARLALVEYCMIGHAANQARLDSGARSAEVSEPHSFGITRDEHDRRSVRALTGAAAFAGVMTILLGPTAVSASEIVAAPIESAGEDSSLTFDHTIRVFTTAGTGVNGASVRTFTDRWRDAGQTDAAGIAHFEAPSDNVDVEVVWKGSRRVVPFEAGELELILARVDSGGAPVSEIDRGDGWEPFFEGVQVMPGRISMRLADGSTVKTVIEPGHVFDVARATQTPVVPNTIAARPDEVDQPANVEEPADVDQPADVDTPDEAAETDEPDTAEAEGGDGQ